LHEFLQRRHIDIQMRGDEFMRRIGHPGRQRDVDLKASQPRRRERPGEWLEYSPFLSIVIVTIGFGWLLEESSGKNPIVAVSNLNTYNFALLMIGLLLHWRPRSFLDSAARAVQATVGIIVHFPIYGGITGIMTDALAADGGTLATRLADVFTASAPGKATRW
jgi:short-chain fatty acids transporter